MISGHTNPVEIGLPNDRFPLLYLRCCDDHDPKLVQWQSAELMVDHIYPLEHVDALPAVERTVKLYQAVKLLIGIAQGLLGPLR